MAPTLLEGKELSPQNIPFEAMQRYDISGTRILFQEERDRHYFFAPQGTSMLFDQHFDTGYLHLLDAERNGLEVDVLMKRLKFAKGLSFDATQSIHISPDNNDFKIQADPVVVFLLDAFYSQHGAEFSLVIGDDGSSLWIARIIPEAQMTFSQNVHFRPMDPTPLFVGTPSTAEAPTQRPVG